MYGRQDHQRWLHFLCFNIWVLNKVALEEAKIWRLVAYPGALPYRVLLSLMQISDKKPQLLSQRQPEMCRAENEQWKHIIVFFSPSFRTWPLEFSLCLSWHILMERDFSLPLKQHRWQQEGRQMSVGWQSWDSWEEMGWKIQLGYSNVASPQFPEKSVEKVFLSHSKKSMNPSSCRGKHHPVD